MGRGSCVQVVEKKRKTECDIQIVHIERESALAYAEKQEQRSSEQPMVAYRFSARFPTRNATGFSSFPHSFGFSAVLSIQEDRHKI